MGKDKKLEVKKDNILEYSMKLALLTQLLNLNKITEREYSMIKEKLKLEHKIN